MVTTVSLPDELHAALRQLADEQRRPMNQIVVEALGRFVAEHEHRARVDAATAEIVARDAELLDRLAK
jgi:predicted transcriptional regulator